jgi:hypothetical protein
MTTAWSTFPVQFTGGLVTNISPLQQGINAVGSAFILQNFEPSLDGGYRKLAGYTKFAESFDSGGSPTNNPVLTGSGVTQALAIVENPEQKRIIAARSGVYYIIDATDTTPAWSSLVTASDTTFTRARHVSYNFNNTLKLVFVDGVNYPAYYNDSTQSMTYLTSSGVGNSSVEGASIVELFKTTLFFGNGTELIFTSPYSDTDFDPANLAGSIGLNSEITGLKVYRDSLIIFCRDKIMRLTGSSRADFDVSAITEDLGCLSADSIQEVGSDIMFLGPDGLRTLSSTERIGDFGIDVASKNIRPTVNELQNYASSFSSTVIRGKAQYRLFGYVGAERVKTSRGVLGTKFIDQGGTGFQWAETKGFKVYIADSQYIDDEEFVLFSNSDGYIYRMEIGTSRDGETIESVYESPFMPVTDPQKRKTFYKLDLYIKPFGAINIDCNIRYNQNSPDKIQPATINIISSAGGGGFYGNVNAIYGTTVYGSPRTQSFNKNIIGSGNTVALRIQDNSTNSAFLLDTAVFEFAENNRK